LTDTFFTVEIGVNGIVLRRRLKHKTIVLVVAFPAGPVQAFAAVEQEVEISRFEMGGHFFSQLGPFAILVTAHLGVDIDASFVLYFSLRNKDRIRLSAGCPDAAEKECQ
jgi:hypothetical protein